MRCLVLLAHCTFTAGAAADQTFPAGPPAEHDAFIGKQVLLLGLGKVGQITGYTYDTEMYNFEYSSSKLRVRRDEFELAELRAGARVQLWGLATADLDGTDEFNGKLGTVTSVDDEVRVTLDSPARDKRHWSFSQENLRVVGYANLEAIAVSETLLHKRVKVAGGEVTGEVVGYDAEQDEYRVIIDGNGGSVSGLKAGDLILLD